MRLPTRLSLLAIRLLTTRPAWSPNGSTIAFESTRGRIDIYLMRPDGSRQRKLTNDRFGNSAPAWAPAAR
jgi:TolB protein